MDEKINDWLESWLKEAFDSEKLDYDQIQSNNNKETLIYEPILINYNENLLCYESIINKSEDLFCYEVLSDSDSDNNSDSDSDNKGLELLVKKKGKNIREFEQK